MYGYIDSNGNKHLLSGQQDIPQYTMEQYTALSVKPDIWVCTNYDSSSEYGIDDTNVKHGNTSVNAELNRPIGWTSVWSGSAYQLNDEFTISNFSTSKVYVFVFKGFSGANVEQFVTLPLENLQFIIQGETSQYVRYGMTYQSNGKYKITDKYGSSDSGAGLINVYEIIK